MTPTEPSNTSPNFSRKWIGRTCTCSVGLKNLEMAFVVLGSMVFEIGTWVTSSLIDIELVEMVVMDPTDNGDRYPTRHQS